MEKEYEFYYLVFIRPDSHIQSENFGKFSVDSIIPFNLEQYKNAISYIEFKKTLTSHDPFGLKKEDISKVLELDELFHSLNGMQYRARANNLTTLLYKSDCEIETDWFDLYISTITLEEIKKAIIRI